MNKKPTGKSFVSSARVLASLYPSASVYHQSGKSLCLRWFKLQDVIIEMFIQAMQFYIHLSDSPYRHYFGRVSSFFLIRRKKWFSPNVAFHLSNHSPRTLLLAAQLSQSRRTLTTSESNYRLQLADNRCIIRTASKRFECQCETAAKENPSEHRTRPHYSHDPDVAVKCRLWWYPWPNQDVVHGRAIK